MGVKGLNHGFGGLGGGGFGRKSFGSHTQTNVNISVQQSSTQQFGRSDGFRGAKGAKSGFGGAKGGFSGAKGGFGGFRGANHSSFSGGYSSSSLRETNGFGRTRGYDSFRSYGDFGNSSGFRPVGGGFGGYGAQSFGGFGARSFGGYGAQSFGGYGAQSFGGYGAQSFGGYGAQSFGGYGAQSFGGYRAQSFGGYGAQSFGGYGAQSFGGYGAQSFGGYGGFGGLQNHGFGGFGGFQNHGFAAPTKSYDVAVDPRATAGYDNAIGAYEVTPRGDIVNARLLAPSAHDAEGGVTTLDGVRAGNKVGFFIVQNAADWAEKLGSGDKLSFRAEDGSRANLADGSPILAINGKPVDQTVFHSLGASLNPDGLPHVVKESNGRVGTIAFEDLTNGGDRDFDDVILHVKPNRTSFWG